ncbi:retromer complex subunit Vps35 [Schizosaccharomyces japonicus yFS275]|uniref:Vacuolar protein sorting-associated protein 35 n=1 Tax=Schizosaccharomyces japonicus (strain yFS275 / FY16936) TaxID=402676 RepID=B6JXB2_SCHJY|nr:retromer complex subunit Vps35 [Schizosaccharomyces japonicus yFS275]EEB06013.1 retromer complex subunit Vps35 [Schizosaccharomyces japonicus yFS275]
MSHPPPPAATYVEAIARPLEESLAICKKNIALMYKHLDNYRFMEAFRYCSKSLQEMRNDILSPKQYYELYMLVSESLRVLSRALLDAHLNGSHNLLDLYELVQYAGTVIPRLYLMITVGGAYVESPDASVRDVISDMLDMSRGVQHPLRGLFLRHFLLTQTRRGLVQLTDNKNDDEKPTKCTITDALDFLIPNFIEMNKLWVRMQHLGPIKEYAKRLQERNELKVLIGTNLVRISQLNELTLDLYRNKVLPAIIEQIVECRDALAQEYLMEVICQVFPDSKHLHTLDIYFNTLLKLSPNVNVTQITVSMIDRITSYVQREADNLSDTESIISTLKETSLEESPKTEPALTSPGALVIPAELNIPELFWTHVIAVLSQRSELSLENVVQTLTSLLTFFLVCYPGELNYADRVFQYITEQLINQPSVQQYLKDKHVQSRLCKLFTLPITTLSSFSACLSLPNYMPVLKCQSDDLRHSIAKMVLENILEKEQIISDLEEVKEVLNLMSMVIEYDADKNFYDLENVPRLVHYLKNDDPQLQYQILCCVKQTFVKAGENARIILPVVINKCIVLVREFRLFKCMDWKEKVSDLWKFVNQCISFLYTSADSSDLAFSLYLFAAETADKENYPEFAYEFISSAFSIYEESVIDSRLQFQQLTTIISVLQQTRNFSTDDYDTLITKVTLYASKLLKKPDQCRGIYLASHLWWQTHESEEDKQPFCDAKRVLECLQKSLKIADACMDQVTSTKLFINILAYYFYFYEQQCESIIPKHINGLIDLTEQNFRNLVSAASNDILLDSTACASAIWETPQNQGIDALRGYLERTIAYAESRTDEERWSAVFQ